MKETPEAIRSIALKLGRDTVYLEPEEERKRLSFRRTRARDCSGIEDRVQRTSSRGFGASQCVLGRLVSRADAI